jgi:hypothetical protein
MQRSSESIGSIAAALAKAQAELIIRRSRWSRRSAPMVQVAGSNGRSDTRRSPAGWTLCAKP